MSALPREVAPLATPFFVPLAGLRAGEGYRNVAIGALHRNELVTCPQPVPGALTVTDCDRAQAFASRCAPKRGGMVNNREGHRSVSSHWIMPEEEDAPWLYARIGKVSGAIASWFGFEVTGFFEPLMIVRYTPGDHFDWHLDTGTEGTCTRKLSLTFQLSSPAEYEGGALEFFPQGELEFARRRGTAIAFPSFYAHRVAPVTRGERCALVAWLHGPTFR